MKINHIATLIILLSIYGCANTGSNNVVTIKGPTAQATPDHYNSTIEPILAKWITILDINKQCKKTIMVDYLSPINKSVFFDPVSLKFMDVWTERYSISGCDISKVLNFRVRNNSGKIEAMTMYPGNGITDPVLYRDAQVQALVAIISTGTIPNAADCEDLHIENTKLIERNNDTWIEEWTFSGCNSTGIVYGGFMKAKEGGFNFVFSKEKPQL